MSDTATWAAKLKAEGFEFVPEDDIEIQKIASKHGLDKSDIVQPNFRQLVGNELEKLWRNKATG